MAYLSNKNLNKNGNAKSNVPKKNTNQPNGRAELVNRKNAGNSNGYKPTNFGKLGQGQNVLQNQKNGNNKNGNNANNGNDLKEKLKRIKEKQKKETARTAIVNGLKAYNPAIGAAAEKVLKTEKGEKLLDEYAKGETPAQGINNVKKELKRQTRRTTIIVTAISFAIPLLFLILIIGIIFKNADSQIYSNENGGTVESDTYGSDDPKVDIFANYPGLYEKIEKVVKKVSDEYQIEVDKYLIIATLVAPINNDLIVPVNDGSCGEEECYYFKGESKTWTEFVESWSDQAELLAKMQIMTYTNNQTDIKVSCGEEQTMEQYAKNDLPTNTFPWYGWLNPANWFKGFRDSADAEVNAKCVEAPNGKTDVPTVRILSIEQGTYYVTNNANKEFEYVKDPNSGGVYFWNLVNLNGFLHEYLKDYLSDEFSDDPEKNYEINKQTIIETADYIYSYYQSIRKDCETHKVLESTIKTIKVYNPPEKQSRFGLPENQEIDFEDQYIGGVMLAEYNSGDIESLKAFAILARTEAIALVGTDGEGIIENSSNDQNYNPEYSKEKYPKIAEAVEATRGMVVSEYLSPKVWHTEYDGFCPQKTSLENGFYYLPKGQQSLPINPEAYEKVTGKEFIDPDSKYLKCACGKNEDDRPKTQSESTEETSNPECWVSKDGELKYKPLGGHGRGASQYGLRYFEAFGYNQDALIRLFFPGASIRMLSGALQDGACSQVPYYTGETESNTE